MTMPCTECKGATTVIDSRLRDTGIIKRHRECKACGHRFRTNEFTTDNIDDILIDYMRLFRDSVDEVFDKKLESRS